MHCHLIQPVTLSGKRIFPRPGNHPLNVTPEFCEERQEIAAAIIGVALSNNPQIFLWVHFTPSFMVGMTGSLHPDRGIGNMGWFTSEGPKNSQNAKNYGSRGEETPIKRPNAAILAGQGGF
jgi:hypothetical protein